MGFDGQGKALIKKFLIGFVDYLREKPRENNVNIRKQKTVL